MELERVDIVLVRPSRAANVAAACRAMKNMGLRSLRLVGAPRDLDLPETRSLAYGAWEVLDGARGAEDLREGVADSAFVVGTTGRPQPGAWTPRELGAKAGRRASGGRLSVVFGPEASGLTRRELEQCHEVVHVPTDPAHPSLNLAQAVLVLAYELRLAALGLGSPVPRGEPASSGALEEAAQDLRRALLEIGHLNHPNPEAILAELRRLLARATPTPREVVLLRGLARQIAWAGRIARGRSPVP